MAASSEQIYDFPHRIGKRSNYDLDMNLIENIVKSYYDKDNERIQWSVFLAYQADAFSYFERVEKYIMKDEPISDMEKGVKMFTKNETRKNLIEIKNNFTIIKEKFDSLIKNVVDNYNATKQVNNIDFFEIFYFISLIFCVAPIEEIINSKYFMENFKSDKHDKNFLSKIYPLTNGTGLFSINSYMYALFNNIYLIGVPSSSARYDGNHGCSRLFLVHDILHSRLEFKNREKIAKFKNLYVAIISDEEFSQAEKELHILIMWFVIHEGNSNIKFYTNSYDRKNDLGLLTKAFVTDFYDEFERFSKFTLNDETISIWRNNGFFFNFDSFVNKDYLIYDDEESKERIKILKDILKHKEDELYPLFLCYIGFIYSIEQISYKFGGIN